MIESWRRHHDGVGPHASSDGPTPEMFVPVFTPWQGAPTQPDLLCQPGSQWGQGGPELTSTAGSPDRADHLPCGRGQFFTLAREGAQRFSVAAATGARGTGQGAMRREPHALRR